MDNQLWRDAYITYERWNEVLLTLVWNIQEIVVRSWSRPWIDNDFTEFYHFFSSLFSLSRQPFPCELERRLSYQISSSIPHLHSSGDAFDRNMTVSANRRSTFWTACLLHRHTALTDGKLICVSHVISHFVEFFQALLDVHLRNYTNDLNVLPVHDYY